VSEKQVDPFDIAALEKSVTEASGRVSAVWVSFILFALYVLIAAGSVTHRQLFLEDPVKMPVLNVDLPLQGFFVVAPILLVIFQCYVLIQTLLLAETTAAYDEALNKVVRVRLDNEAIRQRITNSLFVHLLVGSRTEKRIWLGWIIRVIVFSTLFAGPLIVLSEIQLKFLSYHSHIITWTHRIIIAVDIITMSFLLRQIHANDGYSERRPIVLWAVGLAIMCYVALFLAALSFPGEPHLNLAAWRPWNAVRCDRWQSFERLSLVRGDFVDDQKLERLVSNNRARGLRTFEGERTQSLRDRDFNCANLSETDLRRVDLTGAHLNGANLSYADLTAATLNGVEAREATLTSARLEGSSLNEMQAQMAHFDTALLRGAAISEASMQGASFIGAQLGGAELDKSNLQGAILDYAELTGTVLSSAQLQGASLNMAFLEGAELSKANLGGSQLVRTQLQGTNLKGAELGHAAAYGIWIWNSRDAVCAHSKVLGHANKPLIALVERWRYSDSKYQYSATNLEQIKVDKAAVDRLLAPIITSIDDDQKQIAIKRVRENLLGNSPDGIAAVAENWTRCENNSLKMNQGDFDAGHITFLHNLVCQAGVEKKALAKGILRNWVFYNRSLLPDFVQESRRSFAERLAQEFLQTQKANCAVRDFLDQSDIASLNSVVGLPKKASRN